METKEVQDLLECEHCLEVIADPEDTMTWQGEPYHPNCFDACFAQCRECGHTVDREDIIVRRGHTYCTDCMGFCVSCDRGILIDDLRNFEGERYCEDCYYEVTSEYEEDDNNGPIMDYGNRAPDYLSFLGKPKDDMYFGVELEVEAKDGHRPAEIAENVLQTMPNFVICKEDGSLNSGFEIVTAPASIEEQYKNWEPFFSITWPLLSFRTTTCGMHVHVSRKALTPAQLGRIYVFIHEPANIEFVEMIAGRSLRKGNGGNYAPLKRNALGDSKMKLTDRVGVRFERTSEENGTIRLKKEQYFKNLIWRGAINDSNRDTIEFRIFKGTLKKEGFFKNLEFVLALTQFCKPGVVSLADIASKDKFVDFVFNNRKEYKYLASFIKAKQEQNTKEEEGK